jgi:hypothetical protein
MMVSRCSPCAAAEFAIWKESSNDHGAINSPATNSPATLPPRPPPRAVAKADLPHACIADSSDSVALSPAIAPMATLAVKGACWGPGDLVVVAELGLDCSCGFSRGCRCAAAVLGSGWNACIAPSGADEDERAWGRQAAADDRGARNSLLWDRGVSRRVGPRRLPLSSKGRARASSAQCVGASFSLHRRLRPASGRRDVTALRFDEPHATKLRFQDRLQLTWHNAVGPNPN